MTDGKVAYHFLVGGEMFQLFPCLKILFPVMMKTTE